MSSSKYPAQPILIVDDEELALKTCERVLRSHGFNNIVLKNDSREVMDFIAVTPVSVIILDLYMPYIRGDELLLMIQDSYPEINVIILTGANDVEKAVTCMKAGAFDYMVKPVEEFRLVSGVKRVIELLEITDEYNNLKDHMLSRTLRNPAVFSDIITTDQQMLTIFKYIESISQTHRPVLITGETGVGKELIAHAVHASSGRKGDFVTVNVAGLDDTIFSDTLFGHQKGAFTGADSVRKGLIKSASGGTLFLDEVGDLSLPSQVKLLRLLQNGEYIPLGSDIPKKTDTRLVMATNRSLDELKTSDTFRNDLYYRLITHHIHVPSLRERTGDIPLLVDHFLEKAAQVLQKTKPTPPEELYTLLKNHPFRGNIRELEAVVFDAVSIHESRKLSLDVFKAHISQMADTESPDITAEASDKTVLFGSSERLPTIKQATNLLITEAMNRANGNQTIAAQLLGISRTALNKRLNN